MNQQATASESLVLTDATQATLTSLVEHLEDVAVFAQLDSTPPAGGIYVGLHHDNTDRLTQIVITNDGQIETLSGEPMTIEGAEQFYNAIDAKEHRSPGGLLLALAYAAHRLITDGNRTHPEYRRGLIEAIKDVTHLEAEFGDGAREIADAGITLAALDPAPEYTWTAADVAALTAAIADLNELDGINHEYLQAQVGLWAAMTGTAYPDAERALRVAK